MSFFSGLVDLVPHSNAPLAALTPSLWEELIPNPAFKTTTLEGSAHSVRMGTISVAREQHGLIPLPDPDSPDQIGFALFSGYLLNAGEIEQKTRSLQAGRWLMPGKATPSALIGAIIGNLVASRSLAAGRADFSLLRELNGVFSFAVWLPGRKTFVLGVDRHGIRPLHFHVHDNRVCFSSEIAPLTTFLEQVNLSPSAVDDLVANRFILDDVTQIDGIRRVPPGTLLIASENITAETTYWDVSNWSTRDDISENDYRDGQIAALERSIARCRAIVTQPQLLLSGGNDSRRILLELIRQGVRPECWTAMQFNARLPVEADSSIAAALARKFGLTHHVIEPLDADWEDRWARYSRTLLEYDTAQHYWILPLLKALPVNAGWNFDGYGGDFLVYDTFLSAETTRENVQDEEIVKAARIHISGNSEEIFVKRQAAESIDHRLLQISQRMPHNANTYSAFMANVWSRRRTAHLPQRLLRHKIETVFPYLDNDLVNFSLSYPPTRKIGRNFQREILLHQYPELMKEIPTVSQIIEAGPRSAIWRDFTRPLPKDIDLRRKRALSRTGLRIIRERLPLPALHNKTRATAHLFMLASLFGLSRHVTMRSFWRLEPIGFLGEMIRFYQQPKRRFTMLAEARRFIYE